MAERDRYQVQVVSDVSRDELNVEIVIDDQSLIELLHNGQDDEIRIYADASPLCLELDTFIAALNAAREMLGTIPR